MGQSPESKYVVECNEDSTPFLQGNAEFGKMYPSSKHCCDVAPKIAPKNSLLISVRAPVGALNIADKDYAIGRGLCAIEWKQVVQKYGWWLMHHYRADLNKLATGSTYEAVSAEDIANLRIELPPFQTQQKIADYLDRETARIDALIEAKEKMLSLLEEKRHTLISRAVTKGLDPDVEMKDSGIEWLGEIPAHWEITRLKFLTEEPLAYGANEAALEDEKSWPRFVRITDINGQGNLRPETFKSLNPNIAKHYLLKNGDILFARSGATVGKAFIYKESWGTCCFAGYLIRFRSNTSKVVPQFIYDFTLSALYWEQIKTGTIQATIQNFSAEKYGDLVVCLPPLEEQKQIVNHIDTFTKKSLQLSKEIEKSIALLKERRAALISAAVTGKINKG